jgi:hypothetical protein
MFMRVNSTCAHHVRPPPRGINGQRAGLFSGFGANKPFEGVDNPVGVVPAVCKQTATYQKCYEALNPPCEVAVRFLSGSRVERVEIGI